MDILRFLYDYLVVPIKEGTGYNIVNTLILALLFYILISVYFKFLKAMKIETRYFFESFVPYILLGGVARSLEDAGVYPDRFPEKVFFVTPGIYLVIVAIFTLSLLLERLMKEKKIVRNIGLLLLVFNFIMLRGVRFEVILLTAIIMTFSGMACLLVYKRVGIVLEDDLSFLSLMAHLFEASATFVGVDLYGYGEQHVLAGFLIGNFSSAFPLIILKAAVIPLVLWLADSLDKEEKTYVKTFVIALGLGPGLRDMLSVSMGV